jgi:drug/metabolite transporter (DMT)-like permease
MRATSTLLALAAILIWSFLAFLGTRVNQVPPFLLLGIAFCTSGLLTLVTIRSWRVPWRTFLVGVGGIFGYHFLYFLGLRYAPPVEASLMNYLWPLLIVVLSPVFLPGYRLRPWHILGALSGLVGAGLIVTGGKLSLALDSLPGYLFAAGAALIWACYSLMTKRLPRFPTAAVGGFCLASGVFSFLIYFIELYPMGKFYWPTPGEWLSLVLLGAGPMGAAFFAWDAALKRGDPRIIGSLSYLTPLFSTAILVFLGGRELNAVSFGAMVLIVAGAVVGSLDLFRTPVSQRQPA